jgi:hypothetical protein
VKFSLLLFIKLVRKPCNFTVEARVCKGRVKRGYPRRVRCTKVNVHVQYCVDKRSIFTAIVPLFNPSWILLKTVLYVADC